MGYLTYLGAAAGPPTQIDEPTPARIKAMGPEMLAKYEKGKQVVAQSGCLACHKIGENGNGGPGPAADGDRRPPAVAGDRAHARQPHRAHAVVQRAAEELTGQVQGPGDVRLAAQGRLSLT